MNSIPLIAVIGPVEPALLTEFVRHYRALGREQFLFAFHFTDQVATDTSDALVETCRAATGAGPAVLSRGPWHEPLHGELRDRLRELAGDGWHEIADIDEFHAHPAPVGAAIAAAEARNSPVIGGLLLDRVAADGSLRSWSPEVGLDVTYPLGGFLTAHMLGGNPRKVVLAHSSVPLTLGSHRSPAFRPVNEPLVPVHHFKWRHGIMDDLRRRVREHSSGTWDEITPAIRSEASRLLNHVEDHEGRIDVSDEHLAFTPVSLDRLPPDWTAATARLLSRLRLPRYGPVSEVT
jgi:hypothetical protein